VKGVASFPGALPRLLATEPFVPPPVLAFTLPNGLHVQIVPRGGLPLVEVRLVFRGGHSDDPPETPGFSGLLAEALEEGTRERSSEVLFDLLQGAGGDLVAEATADAIVIASHGLLASWPLLVELLADVVRSAAFPRSGVQRVKELAREDLTTDEAEPSFLAGRLFAKAVYGEHPYGVVAPTRASIRAVAPERLHQERERRLRPDRALLVIVGDVRPEEVRPVVEERFGGWAAGGAPPPPVAIALLSPPRERLSVIDRPGSVQATLLVGNVGTTRSEPEAWPLDLAVSAYGGSFSSRLVQNLRVDKGFTYSPGAGSSWLAGRGVVRSWASVRTSVAGAALAEIFREMEGMASSGLDPDEKERSLQRLSGTFLLSLQTGGGIARELSELFLLGSGPEELGKGIEHLAQVPDHGIQEACRKYLDPRRAVVVAVGDGRKLVRALSSFGPVVRSAPRRGAAGRRQKE
jgi:predicted Zn-dependent peptidase